MIGKETYLKSEAFLTQQHYKFSKLSCFQEFIYIFPLSLLVSNTVCYEWKDRYCEMIYIYICTSHVSVCVCFFFFFLLASRNEISCCGNRQCVPQPLTGLDFEYFRYNSDICDIFVITPDIPRLHVFHLTALNLLQKVNLLCWIIAVAVTTVESAGKQCGLTNPTVQ
jgi:hypothetical protein